jgi:hypothetical protein
MTAVMKLASRPGIADDYTRSSQYRSVGLGVAIVGLMGVMVAAVANFIAAGSIGAQSGFGETLAWTFGLSTLSFGVIKIAIAVILMGIIVRLWFRVDAVKESLVRLHGHESAPEPSVNGSVATPWGKAVVTEAPPDPLLINRMAGWMWRPMLLMGAMALVVGFIASLVWANESVGTDSFRQAGAVSQGVLFLGETFLLSGVAFLLGTILAALRKGGGEVQSGVGARVRTLKMPSTAKAFIALMMVGLMVGIVQFALYIFAAVSLADDPASFSSWSNWLGPFREIGLGLILAGIVLALVTIGNVLAFQFDRVKSIIRTGN